MNHDDNNDQEPSSDQKEETQLVFEQNSFSENPRRLEPVFDDFDPPDLEEEGPYEEGEEDEADEPFQDPSYNQEFEEDSIDYDVSPESLDDDAYESFEQAPEPVEPWQAEDLKPELIRDPEEAINTGPDMTIAQGEGAPWPLGLIVVAVVALLLLGAGGYGVMQQRAAMQEEIRTLQAAIATSASPEEVTASREAQRLSQEHSAELQTAIDSLQLETRSLRDTVRGLELQLASVTATPAPKPVPKASAAAKTTATKKPAASPVVSEKWFVNFGSYQKRETANSWSKRLTPASGKVVVVPGEKSGDAYYRVRVVNLTSRKQAEGIARVLEQEYDLSKLWIGEQ
jgi:cell division septation protein DedD